MTIAKRHLSNTKSQVSVDLLVLKKMCRKAGFLVDAYFLKKGLLAEKHFFFNDFLNCIKVNVWKTHYYFKNFILDQYSFCSYSCHKLILRNFFLSEIS